MRQCVTLRDPQATPCGEAAPGAVGGEQGAGSQRLESASTLSSLRAWPLGVTHLGPKLPVQRRCSVDTHG